MPETRIAITMSHGIREDGDRPLTESHLASLVQIASELGFSSINYDQLEAWRKGEGDLPNRPIMWDFDHAVTSMLKQVHPILSRYGYRGNLFIHTGPINEMYDKGGQNDADRLWMNWDDCREIRDLGWHIGAHTVTHPNLSKLSRKDPTGETLRKELEDCDATLQRELGDWPKDFAYTGTSFSSTAEKAVSKRYRFGRLWIVGSHYECDGDDVRYAEMVGAAGDDEADGGPPTSARYITRDTPAYRLPSMEIQRLIYEPEAFRQYLEGAI